MRLLPALAAILALLVVIVPSCGDDGGSATPAGSGSRSALADKRAGKAVAGADLPLELSKLRSQAGQLLDGEAAAFEARLDELEGHPVVVNKWASWCTPCRAEFPFFASQAEQRAGEIAFIGVNSMDSDADAAAFLDEFPIPYPSYTDPDLEVAEVFHGVAAFPTTAFYDAQGELAYVKQGGYASEELLAEDIERYTR